ncbi:MAG: GNAT family N-acetyltransferase [Muribaculaceae bacterium]|nr:GNAT family N-acetyltransferase [Muribaculaceae bacterium]
MELKLCTFNNDNELEQLVKLQNEVYKARGLVFKPETFKSWYVNNPDGAVISYNAFDGETMVAHQSFVPERMLVSGKTVRCLRSMAVVTHPDYRGKGLFAQLTNEALDEARKQGYEFAYAISNANSTPVFLKHCGFTLITRLNVLMGLGTGINENGEHVYKRYWDRTSLNWRLKNGRYWVRNNTIIGYYGHGVKTFMGVLDKNLVDTLNLNKTSGIGPMLYVGLGAQMPSTYVKVPKFVKHSPFNLIFQDLTGGSLPTMTPDNVFYQLIDYDVV